MTTVSVSPAEYMTGVSTAPVIGELTADDARIIVMPSPGVDVRRLGKRMATLTPLVEPAGTGAVSLPATWSTAVQLAAVVGSGWAPGPRLRAWLASEAGRRTSLNLADATCRLPRELTPYPWQTLGAAMIAAVGKVLITDEPGTGKTATAILGVCHRRAFPAIVVCPASVVDHWVGEWERWAPDVRAVAWRGRPADRHALAGTADVYVCSYDTARMDAAVGERKRQPLLALGPTACVIDECHQIKSQRAQRSLAVRRIARGCDVVVALSGTPITHSPADLWPTLHAVDHLSNPSRERWVQRYCDTLTTDYRQEVLGLNAAREPEFRLGLLGQTRRVAKADVLKDLPDKVYSTRTVELPAEYRKAYDEMARDMLAELPSGEELSVMSVLAQLTRLAQLASAAADVTVTHEIDDEGETRKHVKVMLTEPSWKVDALLEILAERPGSPVVAFAPSRQLIVLAGRAAEREGLRVGYVIGDQSARERTGTVGRFQAGELDVLCATTGAGGVGLTLTAARTAVFLQRPWSIVDATQAEDRIHRIGSERHDSIEVIDVIAKNTIDTRVRAVLRERAGALSDLVQDPRIVAEILGGTERD